MTEHDEFTKGYLQAMEGLRLLVQKRHDALRTWQWTPLGPFANALDNYIGQLRNDFDMEASKMLATRQGGQSK